MKGKEDDAEKPKPASAEKAKDAEEGEAEPLPEKVVIISISVKTASRHQSSIFWKAHSTLFFKYCLEGESELILPILYMYS